MPKKGAPINEQFASWFRAARDRARLTQEELAERLGVSQATIWYLEGNGRESMTPEEVRKLATVLGVGPWEVVEALGYPMSPDVSSREAAERDPIWLMDEIVRLMMLFQELTPGADKRPAAPRRRSDGQAAA